MSPDAESHEGPVWPPFEKMQARLEKWQRQHPDIVQVQVLGESAQGRPIYAVRLTDPAGDDEEKEHVLLTNPHVGAERSGGTAMFATMQWLLSGDRLARKVLRQQLIVCMPVVNPDGYVHERSTNILGKRQYTNWTPDGPEDPPNNPEGVAIQRMLDELQPEVHAEYHGTNMSFAGYIMTESSGASWSNVALRPYYYRIVQLMDEAAEAEGFPSATLESDAERAYWGPELDQFNMSDMLWMGRSRFYAAIYAYYHYHTLPLASEIAWDRSGVARHRRLLQIGNEVWPGEYYPGYPTRVIMCNEFHKIVAYGRTAAARRRSRVELWNKQRQIVHGMNNPQTDGKVLYVCTTSRTARERWLKDTTIKGFVQNLREHPKVSHNVIRRFVKRRLGGPDTARFFLQGEGDAEDSPIEHGLAIRLRVPYSKARIRALHLNGYPVQESETDGYLTWTAKAFTNIQINIPPERSATDDLFVVTLDYDPGERRTITEGW